MVERGRVIPRAGRDALAFSPWMVMEATTAREKLKAFAAQ